MTKTAKQLYYCPAVSARVTLVRQSFTDLNVIGGRLPDQHDYGCTQEGACQHRFTPVCRVQQLSE
jgi:hypothetical protein